MKLNEFKVGDKVRGIVSGNEYTGIVTKIERDFLHVRNDLRNQCNFDCEEVNGNVRSATIFGEFLQKITDEQSSKNLMTNVIEFFKNMTATAEEKMLKEQGMEDPIGTPTEEGLKLSALISYMANRAKIIEIVKAKVEKEKEDKK